LDPPPVRRRPALSPVPPVLPDQRRALPELARPRRHGPADVRGAAAGGGEAAVDCLRADAPRRYLVSHRRRAPRRQPLAGVPGLPVRLQLHLPGRVLQLLTEPGAVPLRPRALVAIPRPAGVLALRTGDQPPSRALLLRPHPLLRPGAAGDHRPLARHPAARRLAAAFAAPRPSGRPGGPVELGASA